ncbi:MAG: hypothetical protein R3F14_11380, partial [Polyangiaceae bacterium]
MGVRKYDWASVYEALLSSLDLHVMLGNVREPLLALLEADRSALCVSRPSSMTGYDWFTPDMPPGFFADYHRIANDDFVRQSVAARPNVVLTDAQMLTGRVEETAVYDLAISHGLKLHHVMSVLLATEGDWHAGVTLYREGKRHFSDRVQAHLSRLVPSFQVAIRNCRAQRAKEIEVFLLRKLTRCRPGSGALLLDPLGGEVHRTEEVTGLLEKWFSPVEGHAGGVPEPLVNRLAQVRREPPRL